MNDYGCRGDPDLEHRWVKSEYSEARFCSKCGVKRADGVPGLAEELVYLLSVRKAKPHIRCRMIIIRGQHVGYRLFAKAGRLGSYHFVGYQWFDQ